MVLTSDISSKSCILQFYYTYYCSRCHFLSITYKILEEGSIKNAKEASNAIRTELVAANDGVDAPLESR